ncbi:MULTISPECIES: glycosyltransferase family 4 protein [unclassified Luteimonas]|uniref:glycosyltransferase family 4 protein n=1 Tax=unclassified Luteimonas TaxID=2629088 RepID=UPI0018F06079|nr:MULTISPECIES: glycosyltransferase family 4 protein [unclassified Luteimonas]MBJ6982888.1 glycosyltransferase family 4 protein [Luteimonas sp. MC1572]MBJ7574508.1 glycosyltransferase family 4 protein [Luteimonas sp. MC1828]QQO04114.1 glycosyltransferase family 4 protein [Luteimonas sp. MC1572]
MDSIGHAGRKSVRKVLYHHRTQGKAVEGVHIRGITDALRAKGVAVDIISLPGADPYSSPRAMSPTRQARPWMKLVTGLPEPLFELAELAYNVVAGWRIAAWLLRNRDVDFIYERYSLFMYAPIWLARLRRIPIILEVNDSATVERVRPLAFRGLAMAIERLAFRNASGLVFVSGIFRDRALAAHGAMAPAIVTPNAADIAKFTFSEQQREGTRARLGLDGHVVCGYLGGFVPWHAIDRFVHRIADHLEAAPHLKLLLVGDGATYPALRALVESRGLSSQVVMTGRVAHDEVPGLLAAMDMAVLPSAGDYTSPVKLFEFMACGVPPVAPDFEPIREVLVEGETGWMFKAGDLDAAVASVLARSRDRAVLARVGAAARRYIAAHRQWRNNIEELIAFHHALAARKAIQ